MRFRYTLLPLTVAAAIVLPALASAASPEPNLVALNAFEVADYASDAHISTTEAARRLQVQARAEAVRDEVIALAGSHYAGTWYDEAHGHEFVVAVDAQAAPSLRKAVSARLRAVALRQGEARLLSVAHSLRSLLQLRDQLETALTAANAAAPGRLHFAVDESQNSVRVLLPATKLTKAQQRALDAVPVDVIRTSAPATLPPTATACNASGRLHCSSPLTGGVQYEYYTTGGASTGCTLSFFVRSKSNQLPYYTTAGHCFYFNPYVNSPAVGWAQNSTNTAVTVGPRHSSFYDGNGDEGMVAVTNSVWNPGAHVVVLNRPDTGMQDLSYYISADGATSAGMRVCYTGSYSRNTDCGTVQLSDTPYDDPTSPVTVQHEAYATGVCGIIPGDSGSPIFSGHTAYGLITSGGNSGGTCVLWYQGIRSAAARLNVDIVHATS